MVDEPSYIEGFIGRREELQALSRRIREAGTPAGESMFLAGERGVGKTALLRQLAAHLFWKQDRIVPFLYPVNAAVLECGEFARDYVAAFMRQRIAFSNRDQALLVRDGMSLQELAGYAGSPARAWVWDVIDRVRRAGDDPLTLLRIALNAPALSAAETGKPVVILVDDFPMLTGLRRGQAAEPSLLSLFDGPLTTPQTLHILTGAVAEFRELALPPLATIPLLPLSPEDAERLFQVTAQTRGATFDKVPHSLVGRLGGNPLYIRRIAGALRHSVGAGEEAFWSVYTHEITDGGLHRTVVSQLMTLFPSWDERRNALEVIHRVCAAGGGKPGPQILQGFITEKLSRESVRALLRSGLMIGGFGGYSAPDDAVLRDIITCLFEREIAGRPLDEVVRSFLGGLHPERPVEHTWDLTVPLEPRAELVVAESLDQIGKNLNIPEETIGQLQMAVIEACINAIEHTKGGDRRLYVSVRTLPDRLEVSVESPGQEFVQYETGEPFRGVEIREGAPRGQGVRLMKRFADAVTFEKSDRGTKVVLVKYLGRPVNPEQEGAAHRE
jgi:serine/threonine-protein kinase RsbW